MSSQTKAPWQDLSFFPEKPAGVTYGYQTPRQKDKPPEFHACNLSELSAAVANRPRGLLVATPEHGRLVPPSCCHELWPAIDTREIRRRHQERKDALVSCLIFGSIVAYSAVVGRSLELLGVLLLVFFGVVPLVQNLIGTARHRLRGKRKPDFAETASRTLFSYWLGTRPVTATMACVYTLAAIFVLQVITEAPSLGNIFDYIMAAPTSSIEAAALDKNAVRAGEWWRLLTCVFLHGNLIHIAFNGTAFYNIGTVLEPLYGRASVLVTFLLSAFVGSLSSYLLVDGPPSVGASGGVLGLIGFLLVVAVRYRKSLPPDLAKSIVRAVLFVTAIGIAAWQLIDNAAHAGGFLTGVLIALPTTRNPANLGKSPTSPLINTTTATAALILAATALFTTYKILTHTP